MIDVSIIIVNYNTCELTCQCLRTLFDFTRHLDFEVILVDNASHDGTICAVRDLFPQVRIIANQENFGFGTANNIGAKVAGGKYLFLLNSDTLLVENVVLKLFQFMEQHPEIASCGGNMIDAEGHPMPSHGRFPTVWAEIPGISRLFPRYYRTKLAVGQTANEGDIHDIAYLGGADIFIRKSVFDDMGGFDENYFLYYEETDLYFRMHRRGYHSILLQDAHLVHLEGGSQKIDKRVPNVKKFAIIFRSKMYYFSKNHSVVYAMIVRIMSAISLLLHSCQYKGYLKEMLLIILTTKSEINNQ